MGWQADLDAVRVGVNEELAARDATITSQKATIADLTAQIAKLTIPAPVMYPAPVTPAGGWPTSGDNTSAYSTEADGKELAGGWDAGVAVANKAQAEYLALGFPDLKTAPPIYFNVDYDAPASAMPAILDALRGVASVIGKNRTGLYAGIGPIRAAFDAGVITYGFQTYAWSGGRWDARAQLQQWSNGQWGGSVDFTRAVKPDFGQL